MSDQSFANVSFIRKYLVNLWVTAGSGWLRSYSLTTIFGLDIILLTTKAPAKSQCHLQRQGEMAWRDTHVCFGLFTWTAFRLSFLRLWLSYMRDWCVSVCSWTSCWSTRFDSLIPWACLQSIWFDLSWIFLLDYQFVGLGQHCSYSSCYHSLIYNNYCSYIRHEGHRKYDFSKRLYCLDSKMAWLVHFTICLHS